jgi:hypothetical protein
VGSDEPHTYYDETQDAAHYRAAADFFMHASAEDPEAPGEAAGPWSALSELKHECEQGDISLQSSCLMFAAAMDRKGNRLGTRRRPFLQFRRRWTHPDIEWRTPSASTPKRTAVASAAEETDDAIVEEEAPPGTEIEDVAPTRTWWHLPSSEVELRRCVFNKAKSGVPFQPQPPLYAPQCPPQWASNVDV